MWYRKLLTKIDAEVRKQMHIQATVVSPENECDWHYQAGLIAGLAAVKNLVKDLDATRDKVQAKSRKKAERRAQKLLGQDPVGGDSGDSGHLGRRQRPDDSPGAEGPPEQTEGRISPVGDFEGYG